jgi:hypothetical protein
MGWLREEAMRVLVGAAVAWAAVIGPAWAQTAGATIRAFGLVGTWSTDCTRVPGVQQAGYRMVVAVPGKGAPTRTTVSSDGTNTTTIDADILAASRLGTTGFVIQVRITGGDRDGGPLPAIALLGFDQSFEKPGPDALYIKGRDPLRLERCPRG